MSAHLHRGYCLHSFSRRLFILITSIACLLILTPIADAQTAGNQQVFVSATFFKVKPGKNEVYVNMVKNTAHKVLEYRFRQKAILGWYFYEALMTGDEEKKYDYVAITVSTNFADLVEFPTPTRDVFMKAISGASNESFDKFVTQINDLRTLVKREVYVHRAGINENTPVSKYVQVDYMKTLPGKVQDYIKTERDVYYPIHQERIKLHALTDWGLYERLLPISTSADSDFVTANFFDDLKSLIDPKYEEAFNNIPHNVDFAKLTEMVEQLRKMVRSDIWKLVDHVDQNNTK